MTRDDDLLAHAKKPAADKYLGGVDTVPICLDTEDPHELIRMVKCLQPSFGAINLEDIAQLKCLRVLDALRVVGSGSRT